jgi:hypothetical protein
MERFCGQIVSKKQINEIIEIINIFPKLSRNELANTICELFSWKRPTGKLKSVECFQFLENLDEKGIIKLPLSRSNCTKKKTLKILLTEKTDIQPTISVKLKELAPIVLERIVSKEQRQLWYEYIDRYHYLGYQLPFGAQLRYFIKSGSTNEILGCFQFSSPAWRMAPRDQWIGWSDEQRKINLQKIVNNSRFLILPWVKVKNLASSALALAAKKIRKDWYDSYGYSTVLMETLVDEKKFKGTCYKAANWVHLGKTTGLGRMGRGTQNNLVIKEIYIYPLTRRFREELAAI